MYIIKQSILLPSVILSQLQILINIARLILLNISYRHSCKLIIFAKILFAKIRLILRTVSIHLFRSLTRNIAIVELNYFNKTVETIRVNLKVNIIII